MFALTLLKWFRENGRELPWRQTRDPYAIWLSEIILQQTQVKQGWDYWERFMRRWPTVEALAEATEDEVLREWQGLGYYSRARNLHYAAKQIVALGHFPDTLEGIKQLKGVGDYTAAAIGSIAFGLPAAVVDGNVYRVLARHFGIDTPINTTEGKKVFAALAQSLLPDSGWRVLRRAKRQSRAKGGGWRESTSAAEYNQAIMDFGAIQCTPQSPRCDVCPLMETCTAFREGRVGVLPVKQKTLQVKERHLTYIYVRCQGETAIHRRGPGDIWQGLYEPLCLELSGKRSAFLRPLRGTSATLRDVERPLATEGTQEVEVRDMLSASGILSPLTSHLSPLKFNVKHVLTHRILMADFYLLEVGEKPALPPDYIWIKETELDQYAKPRLIEILLESLPL